MSSTRTAKGSSPRRNDTQWVSCNAGATAKEGWLCAGGSARYNNCKSFYTGTGYNQQTGTYGNYVNGHGYRVTSRGQHFTDCQAQDNDGWGWTAQANDIALAGCYIDQACQLPAWSAFINQSPVRGGGFSQQKAGINIQSADNCNIHCLVTARGVVNSQIGPELQGILRLNGNSSNNVVTLGFTAGILNVGGQTVLEANYSGSNNYVMTPSGAVAP